MMPAGVHLCFSAPLGSSRRAAQFGAHPRFLHPACWPASGPDAPPTST
jgi:hypothetical protein